MAAGKAAQPTQPYSSSVPPNPHGSGLSLEWRAESPLTPLDSALNVIRFRKGAPL